MKKFDKDKLADVDIYLGEPNEQVRESLRAMMRGEGIRRTRTFARIEDLINALKEAPPDLLIAADDMDPALFDVIRDIRHFKIGRNPFMMITLMVRPENDEAVKKAILAGADDVMIKPVSPGKMLERVAHMTMNRLPFIVTTDYVGPERRRADGTERPSKIKLLTVVNTLKRKVDGQRLTMAELNREVENCMNEVMAARLDSHGLKLGWVCNLILKAYDEKRIDKELEDRILILVSVLEDASRTARAIGEPELANICTQMARQVEEMAEAYQSPSDTQLGTIRKLTKAFELAKTAKAAPPAAPAEGQQAATG
ncbi:MAG: response regulator [Rhodospirillaceae bacterium]|nr:response regulator [Rhodospirillaceae bacterium]